MQIVNFKREHIERAMQLVNQNYDKERGHLPACPRALTFPDMNQFADSNLGVAAFENGEMIGFLSSYPPIVQPFKLEGVLGAYSPKCANAAIGENRPFVYSQMYQRAANRWARAGLSNHAITLYAHDTQIHRQFFEYGFGLWKVNAFRPMEEIEVRPVTGIALNELTLERFPETLPLQNALADHLRQSPMFIRFAYKTEKELHAECVKLPFRYFGAYERGKMIAYIRILKDMGNKGGQTICGAFCLADYRGRGIYQALLNHVIIVLKSEGNTFLEVDFESFNPAARGFWLKYFIPYMGNVVRRIDEKAVMSLWQ